MLSRLARAAAVLLPVLLLATFTGSAYAQDRSIVIKQFDADIVVSKSAVVHVTEHITAQFTGSWNGIYRTIPLIYTRDGGTQYTMPVRVVAAKDENGTPLRMEQHREGAYLKIKAWIPHAADATHTLILSYDVDNALRFFDEHDELYWNVTGDAWEFPIEAVTARVFLPAGVRGLRGTAYTGYTDSRAHDATIEQDSSTITYRSTRPFSLREQMTLVAGWNPGIVARPTPTERAAHFVRSNVVMLIPILILITMLLLWYRYGRDPAMEPVVTLYEPPKDMSPGEVGTVVDGSVDDRDIAATLVDLAVRGHIVINEFPKEKPIFGHGSNDYSFARVSPPPKDDRLRPHEQMMLEGIFESHPDLVELSELHNTFYTTRSQMAASLTKMLQTGGYYRRSPGSVIAFFAVLGFIAFLAVQLLGNAMAIRFGIDSDTVSMCAIASAVIIVLIGRIMPARTAKGVRMVQQVLGFQEFLSRVEGERMRSTIDRPELFEKYLPYAMALGVDKQWAARFAGVMMPPPTWYTGSFHGGFQTSAFVSNLGGMSTTVGQTFSSSPRSSSGSGFGGGGGAGGGGGGGGGGGF